MGRGVGGGVGREFVAARLLSVWFLGVSLLCCGDELCLVGVFVGQDEGGPRGLLPHVCQCLE